MTNVFGLRRMSVCEANRHPDCVFGAFSTSSTIPPTLDQSASVRSPPASGSDFTSEIDKDLFQAIVNNEAEQCERLIKLGANVNLILDRDKADICEKYSGENYIMYECIKRPSSNIKILQLLIEHGCDIEFSYTNNYYKTATPLYFAVLYKNYEICKLLIENGANVNARPTFWNSYRDSRVINCSDSMLHVAASYDLYDICVLFVENGADVLYTAENRRRASDYCSEKIYNYLKQKEEEREMLNATFKRAQIEDDSDDDGEHEDEEEL